LTRKEKIGQYDILDQIDPGGYSVVYKAQQDMGYGQKRLAALKLLQAKVENEEQEAALRKEVSFLLEFSGSPYIVQVYDFGIDSDLGPWIAMELLGRSLKHFITDEPADPDRVRHVVHDVLRGLAQIHAHSQNAIHRDIKPNNILSTKAGTWKIADFGLIRSGAAEDTLKVLAVQFAAPELLDRQRGGETPATDLYALGHSAYLFALGNTLYRKQFPSIYDPEANDKGLDDRPKWLFWHCSQQQVQPLAQLIPGFPQDLSDLIAAMMQKDASKRPQSANEALKKLGTPRAATEAMVAPTEIEEARRAKASKTRTAVLAVVGGVLLLGVAVVGAVVLLHREPATIAAADNGQFKAGAESIPVRGVTTHAPPNARVVVINRASGDKSEAPVQPDGSFTLDVPVKRVGVNEADIFLADEAGNQLAAGQISLERLAPSSVEIVVNTQPPVDGAKVTLTPDGNEGKAATVVTNLEGVARAPIPFGKFRIQVEHPRFQTLRATLETGTEKSRPTTASLLAHPASVVSEKQKRLVEQMRSLVTPASGGEKPAAERIGEISAELVQLEEDRTGQVGSKRISLLEEMQGLLKRTLTSADAGPMNTIVSQLASAYGSAAAPSPVAAAPAQGGQPAPAGDTNQELVVAQKRLALVQEMRDMTGRAAAGDAFAKQRIEAIQQEFRDLEPKPGQPIYEPDRRRQTLLNEVPNLRGRFFGGDLQAAGLLNRSHNELLRICTEEILRIQSGGLPQIVGDEPDAAAENERATIMKMPVKEFKEWIEKTLVGAGAEKPLRQVEVVSIPGTSRVIVRGPVLSLAESAALQARLNIASERVVIEVKENVPALIRRIQEAFEDAGAEVFRVAPITGANEQRVDIQFKKGSLELSKARKLAAEFFLLPDTAVVKALEAPPAR
jgi:tRNA A-37 threonylcarbamoyl transferase component Bud32